MKLLFIFLLTTVIFAGEMAKFSPPPKPICVDPHAILPELTPILRGRLSSTNYDRVYPCVRLIEHILEGRKNGSEVEEIIRSFHHSRELEKDRGGACVPLTLDLAKYIPKKFRPYLVGAKLPNHYQQKGFPKFCHTAILIQYENGQEGGFILLDPGFDVDRPIIVNKDGTPSLYLLEGKQNWEFRYKSPNIVCKLIPLQKPKNFVQDEYILTYRTDAFLNPMEASATPMVLADRRLALLSRDHRGFHHAHLNIELDRERILWSYGRKRMPPISFAEFLEGKKFPSDFTDKLFIPHTELHEKISFILEHKSELDKIHIQSKEK